VFSSITGKYNFKLANNWVDPAHEMTPQDLATMCFNAMGVALFDVSKLPNDARPEVDWVSANAAAELDKICADLGCIIVPKRSYGGWSIEVKGEGDTLPEGYPFTDWGIGVDPQETPDYIKIVTAPIRYQAFLPLGPVVQDFNYLNNTGPLTFVTSLSWKPMKYASYAPYPSFKANYGFDVQGNFANLSRQRRPLPDGTKVSPQELAQQTAFTCFRVEFAKEQGATRSANYGTRRNPQYRWGMRLPGINYPVCVEQLILTDELVDTYTDYYGEQHRRPAFIQGRFRGDLIEDSNKSNGNYPPGTRIDKQFQEANIGMDERASFSLSFDPLDSRRSIISISRKIWQNVAPGDAIDIPGEGTFYIDLQEPTPLGPKPLKGYVAVPPSLQFCCAFNIRDPYTWEPYRYEYYYQIGTGTNKAFCRTEIKEDIQPWVKGIYPYPFLATPKGAYQTHIGQVSNQAEVDADCLYYAQSLAREYIPVATQTRTYFQIMPTDMNGLIQQITYEIGPGGTSTTMSAGTEHSWITPSAEDRRQQVARSSLEGKLLYYKYETARRNAMIGRYNT
jgi:hypothetical protein